MTEDRARVDSVEETCEECGGKIVATEADLVCEDCGLVLCRLMSPSKKRVEDANFDYERRHL